jgi:hypothetical protein
MDMSRGIASLFMIVMLGAGAVRVATAQQSARPVDDAALKDAAKTGEDWIS